MGDVAQRALSGRERVVADVREVFERVYRARREIHRTRGMDIRNYDEISVWVGIDFWDALWALHPLDGISGHMLPVQRRVVPVDGHEPEFAVFLMGVRVKRDERLDPRGIVIRSEVVA